MNEKSTFARETIVKKTECTYVYQLFIRCTMIFLLSAKERGGGGTTSVKNHFRSNNAFIEIHQ